MYVFADMEGISGITNSGQTLPGGQHYREGCRLMAEDINACVAGCFDAGATCVVVRDGHGGGLNVDPKLIDARAKLIQGPTPGERFKDIEGAEALSWLDGIVTCEVKKGTGWQSAECLQVEEARRLLRKKAEEAVRLRKTVKPLHVRCPVTLRWDYLPKGSLRTYDLAFKPVADPRRVEKAGDSVERVFLSK